MVNRYHLALTHQLLDQIVGFDTHTLGQLANRNHISDPDLSLDRLGLGNFCLLGRPVRFSALAVTLVTVRLINLPATLAPRPVSICSTGIAALLFLFR